VLLAQIADESGGDSAHLGPLWQLEIEGRSDLVVIGHPIESTLAELLGHDVAHDEWPGWMTDLAGQIAADLR
jgi:hypothetical protein